jgi:hypothetical protein
MLLTALVPETVRSLYLGLSHIFLSNITPFFGFVKYFIPCFLTLSDVTRHYHFGLDPKMSLFVSLFYSGQSSGI